MRKAIGIFALVLTACCSGEARSAEEPFGAGQTGVIVGGPMVGAYPAQMSGCNDDVWCPLYSYFTYYPNAARKQTLQEYHQSWKKRVPGMNPDVFAIPPLPYGPGRTGMGTPKVTTAPAATAPAAAAESAPAAAAPAPPAAH
jgi:hypothetical protein